jgi:hypothetical protein
MVALSSSGTEHPGLSGICTSVFLTSLSMNASKYFSKEIMAYHFLYRLQKTTLYTSSS